MHAIEVFKQRDCVLARNLRPLFELRNGEFSSLMGCERVPDVRDHVGMIYEIGRKANELAVLDQSFQQPACFLWVRICVFQNFTSERRLKSRLTKCLFQLSERGELAG